MTPYVELAVTTNYSFLRSASHPHEVVEKAAALGYPAVGIADRNTLAGVVRAYSALRELKEPKPRLLTGARLVFRDGTPDILAYPRDRTAYGRLCRLLSIGKLRAPKGECYITLNDLLEWQDGLYLIALLPRPLRYQVEKSHVQRSWNEKYSDWTNVPDALVTKPDNTTSALKILKDTVASRIWLGLSNSYLGDDVRWMSYVKLLASEFCIPLIATNDVCFHIPERRMLQDILTCIRNHVTLDTAGKMLEINSERYLKSTQEMNTLFAETPEALAATLRFADCIEFTLDQLKYNYPTEPVPKNKTPQQHLEDLVWQGLLEKYGHSVPKKITTTIEKELALISKMGIAQYFLTVHEIVQFARTRKPEILCQGRGSAANSVVCYVLGITSVNPMEIDVLFERFISENRKEPPDIDVDFEHERREEVIQYIYNRYGHHRAALAATVICYRPRSAIREVGKVFGLTEDITSRMANSMWGGWGDRLKSREVIQGKLDPQNPLIAQALRFANELIGFPRHLSQHVGGFILTQDRLDECVPVGPATMENRFFIEWDKDDINALNMMKIDVLALGMLTCIRKAFDLVSTHQGIALSLDMKPDQKDVYEMLQSGNSIGVFQVESRAQMSMLPRLRPEEFYDLVVQVAIVRPGPIQGDMVHPYLKNRKRQKNPNNKEPIHFPGSWENPDELRSILGKTYGVPLFQEQAMRLAITAAAFSPDEANGLRRAMATFRNVGTIEKFKNMFVGRMVKRGYDPDFAVRCFRQIEGFGSYGFPESHAASFALLVYVSAFLKKRHPAAFSAALLNSQPMGFYAPAEIVRDARERGKVEVRQVDVNYSQWDNTLESNSQGLALRLGFRQIRGFQESWANLIVTARGNRFNTVADVSRKAKLPKNALIILAEADSFQSLDKDRREILWAVRRLPDDRDLPLFAASYVEEQSEEEIAPLPLMPLSEQVVTDYQMLRLSLKSHLMSFLRKQFLSEGFMTCKEINMTLNGRQAKCAGIVLIRQMPGDAGVVFVTLSDETDVSNVVIWPRLVSLFRREIMGSRLMAVEGRVQRGDGDVVHLVAERISDRSSELRGLLEDGEVETVRQVQTTSIQHHPRNAQVIPKSRDFH